MVPVAALHHAQQAREYSRPAPGQCETDLEIAQAGLAVVAHQNILALVQIDVGQAALMKRAQRVRQAIEKASGYALMLGEGMSLNIPMRTNVIAPHAVRGHAIDPRRYVR